ncbi:MAG: hypothetical protein ACHQVS_00650 [Candidatus Babeliales bacterium]
MKQEITVLNHRNKAIRDRLRSRVQKIMRSRSIGPMRIVHEAGVHHSTLGLFLKDIKLISFIQMCKIEDWVLEHEFDEEDNDE